ncbi:MAG: oligosaccharide flippase family protein [Flavihumibacter sp.]|nr:oligosaccharide flippase family protein [Flavihumibacter sp.]
MTRTLGPEGYGIIGFYESLMSVVMVLSAFGVQYYGLRLLSKTAIGDAREANSVLHLILINLVMAFLGVVCYSIYLFFKPAFIGSGTIAFLYGFIMLQYMLHMDWYFQSQERFQLLLTRTLIARLLVLSASLIFVRQPSDLIYYIIISACNYLFISSVAVYNIRDLLPYWKWDYALFKKLLRALAPFAVLGVLGSVYFAFDTIILARIGQLKELGYYTVAAKIVRIGINVFSGASVVFFVKLFRSSVDKRLQSDSLLTTIHLSYPIGAILFFFAEAVIFFVSGVEYQPSIHLLRIFSLLWLVVPFHDFFVLQVLVLNHKEKWVLFIYLAATIVSFLLNLFLIPIWFSTGAAWAIVISETLVLILGIYLSRNYFFINKQQWLEIAGVLFVFPITYGVFKLTNQFVSSPLLNIIAGTGITLALHILLQLTAFKSRIWKMGWMALKARINRGRPAD